MKKPLASRPRLALDKSTVRHLDAAQLAEVAGGIDRISRTCITTTTGLPTGTASIRVTGHQC